MAPLQEIGERWISLGPNTALLPERLLLAHGRGEVLFIGGAGISRPSLPGFRGLVLDVYKRLDQATHQALDKLDQKTVGDWKAASEHLTDAQRAEVRRFDLEDYDVVLGIWSAPRFTGQAGYWACARMNSRGERILSAECG
jgi:hypothetical protein